MTADADPAAVVDALARTAREVRTPCGDGTMVWRVWGAGEPLVLFHGGSGSWTHWIRNIPELSRHFELWVADIPGLGSSTMPPQPWVPATIADVVVAGLGEILLACASAARRLLFRRANRRPDRRAHGKPHAIVDADRRCGAGPARRPARAVRQGAHRHERGRDRRGLSPEPGGADVRRPANIDALAVHLQAENIKRARFRSRPFAPTDSWPARSPT